MKRLRLNKRGVSNVIVVMLSLVLIVIVVANVILWSYQMNQFDWERMQEKISLTNAEQITRSTWFTSKNEYAISIGSRLNGTYADTQTVEDNYESFRESLVPTNLAYNPYGYSLVGLTKRISGLASDLETDNEAYMVFRSYSSAFSAQPLYAHRETMTIAGASYYELRLSSADSSGLTLQASASTTGRKLLGRCVYSLTGATAIPSSTWTVYYRAYKTGTDTQVVAHCDIGILIRQANGTVRATLAAEAANSPNLNRDSYTTVSATYVWGNYTVVDDTDYLEIDYYAHVTSSQSGRNVYLRVDDSGLATSNQTRITNVMLPSSQTVEIELAGSSNTQNWERLTWTADNAFTVSTVNATLQLYDYNAGQYPPSGNGRLAYISSATPNTDEIKNQTIMLNPAYYRNATGWWRMRITGAKNTVSPFDLKVDWVEFRATLQDSYRLDISGGLKLDLSTYPAAHIRSVEIQTRYKTSDSLERWFLKAYNWTKGEYSDSGFNSTSGDLPTSGFKYYTINLASAWQSYVQSNGTIRVEFCDAQQDANQTTVDIDFLGVRAIIDGVKLSLQNEGPVTCHIVGIWIVNSTTHKRYSADFFFNSGVDTNYVRADLALPAGSFIVKAVTERGNTAVFRKS